LRRRTFGAAAVIHAQPRPQPLTFASAQNVVWPTRASRERLFSVARFDAFASASVRCSVADSAVFKNESPCGSAAAQQRVALGFSWRCCAQ
jgi:hypothetical protein